MDRNREARRASMVSANGLSRRRPRSSGLRDSPEEDGPVDLQETARLRDRGVKKDRDRDRDRDRERDRDRDRLNRSKRRRADRLMHGSNREDAGDDSSEDSVNDDEEEEDDDGGGVGSGAVRMLPPNPAASMSNHHHHQPHRKSYPPSATTKGFKPAQAAQARKPAEEMIGFSVPRKARSVSTKRSHESWTSGSGVGGEQQTHRQTSTSPVRPSLASPSRAGPVSPSSSNASGRKKMKPNGSKPRPPKSSGTSASSNPEELEFEIAEVLYGLMTQSQAPPPKKEATANDSAKFDSREANKSNSDGKSRVSSPISNSASTAPQSSYAFPPNSSSGATPVSVVAPKRKRPRQVSDNLGNLSIRNSPISSSTTAGMKVEIDQPPKAETSSPNSEKNPGSAADNGGFLLNNVGSEVVPPQSEPLEPDSDRTDTSVGLLGPTPVIDESRESRVVDPAKDEVVGSPKKESPAVRPEDNMEASRANKPNSTISEIETKREGKFEIDLMAPPPQLRSSPEREGPIDLAEAPEHKPALPDGDSETRPMTQDKNDEKGVNVEPELKKAKPTAEETESDKKPHKERNIDLQLDLEKPDRDSAIASGSGTSTGNKLHPHVQKQQQQLKPTKDEIPHSEKTAQSSSLPLPMSVASWPGGLPPVGYMAPLQGVVSMDGSPVPPSSIQPLFSQPRPKRCATHCYIARNIHYLQQLMKINPFWPAAAAGPASLFGAKACNLNVVPSAEMHGNMVGRSVNSMQDKGQGMAIFPSHAGKDKASQAANIADAQRKQQILLQQAMPPGAPPNNILHAPAYIFPFNQQHVAAASVRPGSAKSPTTAGNVTSTSAPNSAPVNGSATPAPTAAAVSFNYPNMPAGETQYLAILQNNAYPFPIPAVGAPPTYRGSHAQAMSYFNSSFYPSQMIHPAQLQQQQQQQHLQHTTQAQQAQQVHQNPSISNGSSSSQKHLQTQHQRTQGSGINGGNGSGNIHSFPTSRTRPAQASQQQPNQHLPTSHQGRQLEIEGASEDSPSTADSRVSRTPVSVYGQNYAMSIHHPNFAIMTPALAAGASASSNQNEKKQPQQQGMKAGVESLPQTFAMSFASINGASPVPGIDLSSVAQNHPVLQSLPEARHSCQIMAAAAVAQAAQQKKGFRISEEGKAGGDSSSVDEDKKGLSGKPSGSLGQSIAFSRPDITDASVSTIPGSAVIDGPVRSLNLVSASSRNSRSTLGNVSTTNYPLQAQLQYQQPPVVQLQKHPHQHPSQQIAAAVAARNKPPATSNGSVYPDHSTPPTAKFPNALSPFPQNLVQNSGGGSAAQSHQWKNSARTSTQVPSSFASSTTASLKNLPQQHARTPQSHTLSFGATQKSLTGSQGQQTPNSHQSPSPPMMVGSPTTSISKGASGSPRTASSTSQGSKAAQPSTLSSQQSKNSASVPSQKSSPVGGRNVPSILGNPHITSSTTVAKPQMQQQQLAKQIVQQPQIIFSPSYMQAQSPASSTTSGTSAYLLQGRRPEQQQQSQQLRGSTSSTGMLSLCPPVTLAGSSTSDAKAAVAAAASNIKGGGLPSQTIFHPVQFTAQSSGNSHQIVPTGLSYVPPAVQVKPAEQKQPAA